MEKKAKKQGKANIKVSIETSIIDQLDAHAAKLGITRDDLITLIIDYQLARLNI